MIKIIKPGKLSTALAYVGVCENCNCEVEATYEDHSADWIPSRRKNGLIEVKCPTENCNHSIRCKVKS